MWSAIPKLNQYSALPLVISAKQQLGPEVLTHLFYLTRTWCFSLHKAQHNLLGLWRKLSTTEYLPFRSEPPNKKVRK